VFQNVPQQIEVLNHRGGNLITKDTKDTKKKFGWTKCMYLAKRLCGKNFGGHETH
jgi:hypothetical protein